MGSLESAHAIAGGDKRIHVWSPASSLYRESFVRDWNAKQQGTNPIAKEEALALTPMAIVMWKQRYDAFTARSPEVCQVPSADVLDNLLQSWIREVLKRRSKGPRDPVKSLLQSLTGLF
jgi:hypothetical protein